MMGSHTGQTLLRLGIIYRGFSGKAPEGGVFILASLKSHRENTSSQEINFYRLKLNYAA